MGSLLLYRIGVLVWVILLIKWSMKHGMFRLEIQNNGIENEEEKKSDEATFACVNSDFDEDETTINTLGWIIALSHN